MRVHDQHNRASMPRLGRRGFLAGAGLLALGACTRSPAGSPGPRPAAPTAAPAPDARLRRTADRYRPRFHFTPPSGNLADPNGLVHFDGEYHLFHQSDGSWSHAVSTDRWHWRDLPTAVPSTEASLALSGSAVVDHHDTSGLFGGDAGLVTVFTSTATGEAQSIATSPDGRTFTPYDANPVLPNDGRTDFRDPKVFRHQATGRWVMVVATGDQVSLFGSADLRDWEHLSDFGADIGLHSAVWECPDLFPLPLDGDPAREKWVLHVSVGDSDATDGSTAQWFVGDFDGTTFVRDGDPAAVDVTDFGQDFYAAQTWSDDPTGGRTWLGWMANWRYPYQAPTGDWHGAMSVPRELALETRQGRPRLVQRPLSTEPLRAGTTGWTGFDVSGTTTLAHRGTAFELVATVSWDDAAEEVGVRVRSDGAGAHVATGFRPRDGQVFLDRSASGTEPLPARDGSTVAFGRRSAAAGDTTPGRTYEIRVLVDTSSVEVFLDEGQHVGTNLVFTDPAHDGVELYADGGALTVHALEIHDLEAIWTT